MNYPKRLIEVDLPIKRISQHARNEKNMRKGHPWHLHIWWARRPWGACRAVTFASLVPAPTDPDCPDAFINKAAKELSKFGYCSNNETDPKIIEKALLNFTGELALFNAGSNSIWIETAKNLIRLANADTPIAFDPFSGYGAIPAEAARLGCESIANDLNPVAVTCLKVMLEAIPKHGERLLELYTNGVEYIKREAEKRLSKYYPKKNGKYPIAYLWARTVTCEAPGCGATIPLISQNVLAKGKRKAWIEINGDSSTKEIKIDVKMGSKIPKGLIKTAGGGHAVCPVCGTTNHKERVKAQGKEGKMGNRLFGLVYPLGERAGKIYFNADLNEQDAFQRAVEKWNILLSKESGIDIDEKYPFHDPRAFTAGQYGITKWGDLFSPRQKLSLHTLGNIVQDFKTVLVEKGEDTFLIRDTITALALGISNAIHYNTNVSTWLAEHMISSFITGNAIAMRWDWAEANPLIENYVGGIDFSFTQGLGALKSLVAGLQKNTCSVLSENAEELSLPDDSADYFFTDPPYYDVVPYADLSDLNFVWLKRMLKNEYPDIFSVDLTPKSEQIVVNPYAVADGRGEQSHERYKDRMTKAFAEGRRALKPNGIGTIVFAHKGTAAWESLLASVIDAGFVVTASWPFDTERASRMRANDSAALQTSVHLVVRPRENPDGSLMQDHIGDWREVQAELPRRIHQWMPRLAAEGVVGADAIFACLGPALEIFSRYSRVEKPDGTQVTLRDYLERVWAAVSQEALNMVFEGGDAGSLEEDARVTAMWLWTLSVGANGNGAGGETAPSAGYSLEYDTARKIAQGLGANLETMKNLVEIKGDKARLLPVHERAEYLFGRGLKEPARRKRKEVRQLILFEEFMPSEEEIAEQENKLKMKEAGKTVLDRLHQAMLLFAAGRTEALKRFLSEDGAGRDDRFWKLAQALNALYPQNTDERRWVEAVQTYKKSLGF